MTRSISDEEIGLIKALLARGERNVDIQFLFNRQDRPVNSGRISQIRNGTCGPEIPQATEDALDAFLAGFPAAQAGVAIHGVANAGVPTIAERAAQRFEQRDDGNWYLRDGETSDQECKVEFDPLRLNPIIRAVAALANNNGGFLFLGVENDACRVVGLPDGTFSETDIVRISDKLKSFLIPTPDFTKIEIEVGGLSVGVIYVEKFSDPPIIVCRDGEGLSDGSILFRYPGQSAKIKFGDLLSILRERDRASQAKLLKFANRISQIGTDKSLVVDTGAGTLETSDMQLMIDRQLADQLEFIREGEFEEVAGAPTLRLVGDVRAVDSEGAVQERISGRALSADEVLSAFLRRERVRSPIEYIKVSALVQRQWLPIFYFLSLSGKTADEVIDEFNATNAVYANCKQRGLERLMRERSAFYAATGEAIPVLERIVAGDFENIRQDFGDRLIVRAVQALPADFENFEPIFELLDEIFASSDEDTVLKGYIFRAAARLDELAY